MITLGSVACDDVARRFRFLADTFRWRRAAIKAFTHRDQLVVVYCREAALAAPGPPLRQFLRGIEQLPVPVSDSALVISDNGDLYGTLDDVRRRGGTG
jgi:hypothetical protein